MDRQTRLPVIASIHSYRSLCILLQEYLNRNLIHPIALQQLTDLLYSIHYHDSVLHDFRSCETLLNPYIIETQPPYPGRKHKLKIRKNSREMPLATAIRSLPPLWKKQKEDAMPFTAENISRIDDINISIQSYKQIRYILKEIYQKNLIHRFAYHQLLHFFYCSHFFTNLPNFCEHYHYFLPPLLSQLEKPLRLTPIPLDSARLKPTVVHTWSLYPPIEQPPNYLRDIIRIWRKRS
jgi:hypothetical protein